MPVFQVVHVYLRCIKSTLFTFTRILNKTNDTQTDFALPAKFRKQPRFAELFANYNNLCIHTSACAPISLSWDRLITWPQDENGACLHDSIDRRREENMVLVVVR